MLFLQIICKYLNHPHKSSLNWLHPLSLTDNQLTVVRQGFQKPSSEMHEDDEVSLLISWNQSDTSTQKPVNRPRQKVDLVHVVNVGLKYAVQHDSY